MSTYPRRYNQIDNIQLNVINILNNDNSVPSTGFVLTQAINGISMLPITYALDTIPGLSDLSGNISSVSTVTGLAFSTINYVSTATGLNTSTIYSQSTTIGLNYSTLVSLSNGSSTTISTLAAVSSAVYENTVAIESLSSVGAYQQSTINTLSSYNSSNYALAIELSSQISSIYSSISFYSSVSYLNAIGISTLSTTYETISINTVSLLDFQGLSTAVLLQSSQISTLVEATSANTINISSLSGLINTLSTDVSTILGVQVSKSDFAGLSTTVLGQSTQLGHIGASLCTTIYNLSSLSSSVLALSTTVGTGEGKVTVTEFQGLSTNVLGQSTQIGNIWGSLCTNIANLSSLSSYVIELSTLAGNGTGLGSFATNDEFIGLSTYVLGQSTQLGDISLSLCTSIANLSSLSSSVNNLSTTIGAGFVTFAVFQGLSSYVLGQSTTIRSISDSLSTGIFNLSSLSSYVISLSTNLGNEQYSLLPHIQTLSITVLTQSTQISGVGSSLCTSVVQYSTLSSYVALLSTTFGVSTNIYTGNTSNLLYGIGNTASASGSAAGGSFNIASTSNSIALGERNVATGTAAAAFGFSTSATVDACLTLGQYAVGRVPGSINIAGGALSTSAGLFVSGSAQTSLYNLFGMTTNCNVFTPLGYFSNVGLTTIQSNIPIRVINTTGYLMQSIDMRLTGYEMQMGAGGVAGNGFYFGRYQFNIYWDNTTSRTLYVCDYNGITSNGSNTLTPITTAINKMNGAPTITALINSSNPSPGIGVWSLSVRAASSNTINWLAQVNAGEVLGA